MGNGAVLKRSGVGVRMPDLAVSLAAAFYLVTSVGNFFLTLYFREVLHFTGAQVGALFAIQAGTSVFAAFPAGASNDLISSRALLTASLIGHGVGFFLMTRVTGFAPFALVFFGWTLANGLFKISLDVHVLKTGRTGEEDVGIATYQAARFLGLAAGTLAAGYLIAAVDFRTSLVLAAALCLVLVVPALRLPATRLSQVRLADYRTDLRSPGVLFFYGWLFIFATHWGAEYTSYSLFLKDGLGLDLAEMGSYMTVEFLVMTGTFLYLRTRHWEGRSLARLTLAGILLSGVGHMGMVTTLIPLSLAFRGVHAVGDASIFLVFYLGIAQLFQVERRGGNTGMVNMVTMTGMILGSLVYGPLGAGSGYHVPLFLSGLTTCLLGVGFLAFSRRFKSAA